MSPGLIDWIEERTGFPRVSGDEPSVKRIGESGCKFSPRERG